MTSRVRRGFPELTPDRSGQMNWVLRVADWIGYITCDRGCKENPGIATGKNGRETPDASLQSPPSATFRRPREGRQFVSSDAHYPLGDRVWASVPTAFA